MIGFLVKRLAGLVATLLIASFVVYASIYVAPGSPENVLFGSRPPPEATRRAVRHDLGLDQPFLTRWAHWLDNVLHGNFGTSLISQQSVSARIAHPTTITLALVGYSAVIVVVLGIGLGLLSALRPGVVDVAVTAFTSLATALPAFVASSVAISIFAVRFKIFPAYGLEPGLVGWIRSLTLPALCLATISLGLLARTTRAVAKEQLASDVVQTARARGISNVRIVRSHVLRLSANSVVTIAGLQVAGLFAAAVVVENAFGLGGLGQLLISSVQQKDFPVVQAISLLFVFAFVGLNTVADLVNAVLDPRLRSRAGAS
ncbi:ABC transporter permease [uncultured Jatrophihabitans sp.]|uniref:ABC transporter permease n=1 Tax=uncultured Jatrophihabitans sp. TaxID=1610747 RepID=UPI0035CC3B18